MDWVEMHRWFGFLFGVISVTIAWIREEKRREYA